MGGGACYARLTRWFRGRQAIGVGSGDGLDRIILILKRVELGPEPPQPPVHGVVDAQCSRDLRAGLAQLDVPAANLVPVDHPPLLRLRPQRRRPSPHPLGARLVVMIVDALLDIDAHQIDPDRRDHRG